MLNTHHIAVLKKFSEIGRAYVLDENKQIIKILQVSGLNTDPDTRYAILENGGSINLEDKETMPDIFLVGSFSKMFE